ncbi:MAG: DsbA family protein, partial [Acidimicrobiia bacterium]
TSVLERRDWVYDTEPAAIAVTQMRDMNEPATLGYFTDIQMAFYARGQDITDFEVLTELAHSHGVDTTEFAAALPTAEAKKRAWDDFSRARNWGISGFPTLIGVLEDGRLALLARGWAPADTIRDRMSSLVETAAS